MKNLLFEIQKLNEEFMAKEITKISEICFENSENIQKSQPFPISMANEVAAFFEIVAPQFERISVRNGYNAYSKDYVEIPHNITIAEKRIGFCQYEFNMYDRNSISSEERETILKTFHEVLKEEDPMNAVDRIRFMELTRTLLGKYPQVLNWAVLLKSVFAISQKNMQKIYFEVLKAETRKKIARKQFDFEKMAIFYCRQCVLFLCDVHFNQWFIRGKHPYDESQFMTELAFFSGETRWKASVGETDVLADYHNSLKTHTIGGEIRLETDLTVEDKKLVGFFYNMGVTDPCMLSFWTKLDCARVEECLLQSGHLLEMRHYSNPFVDLNESDSFATTNFLMIETGEKRRESTRIPESKSNKKDTGACLCEDGCVPIWVGMSNENQKCPCVKTGELTRQGVQT